MNRQRILVLTFAFGLVIGGALWFSRQELQNASNDANRVAVSPPGDSPGAPIQPAPAWEKAPASSEKGARTAIIAQLEAFKRDDWKTAEKYQSARLRANFRSTENFRQTIEKSYPQFADYRKIRFFESFVAQQTLKIGIEITGMNGTKSRATYLMNREKDGWKVSGVMSGIDQNIETGSDQLI